MTDKRAYFKLDVGYLTNPKVAAISLESPTAVILHIGCIAYAAQHLTDGVVPVALVLRLTGATKDDADLLYKYGLLIDRGSGEAEVHDYLEHQRSAAEVKGAAVKAKRAAAARWTPTDDASSNASSMPDALPDASEVAMPRERERERVLSAVPGDDDAPKTRRKPERPLPASWAPNAGHYEMALDKGVDIKVAVTAFRNHAATHDRRARDWDAAFRTWLDKTRPTTPPTTGTSPWDRTPKVGG